MGERDWEFLNMLIEPALAGDIAFLEGQHVIDYSLLIKVYDKRECGYEHGLDLNSQPINIRDIRNQPTYPPLFEVMRSMHVEKEESQGAEINDQQPIFSPDDANTHQEQGAPPASTWCGTPQQKKEA